MKILGQKYFTYQKECDFNWRNSKQSSWYHLKHFSIYGSPNNPLQFLNIYVSICLPTCLPTYLPTYLPSAISSNFWGGAGCLASIARRETVVQLESLRSTASPPQWCPEAKPRKMLAILHFKQLITSIYLSIYQSLCLSVFPFVCLFIYVLMHLCLQLFIYLCRSLFLIFNL